MMDTPPTIDFPPTDLMASNQPQYASDTVAALEPRVLRIEMAITEMKEAMQRQENSIKEFQNETNQKLDFILEMLELSAIGGTKGSGKQKGGERHSAYIEAQCSSVEKLLNADMLSKTCAFVFTRYIVEVVFKKEIEITKIGEVMKVLFFAPTSRTRKHAATTELGKKVLSYEDETCTVLFVKLREYCQ